MSTALIAQSDLVLAFKGGVEQVRRFAGDDGAGNPDPVRVAYGIGVASDEGYGILLAGGWSPAQIVTLAADDAAVRHALCIIWRWAVTDGVDEFRSPEGISIFFSGAKSARDTLRGKASGSPRTIAEADPAVGPSANLAPRASNSAGTPILGRDRSGNVAGF